MVNQILDFANRKQKDEAIVEKTDIVELLQKVMDNFRLIAKKKVLISLQQIKSQYIAG